jgi:hypothetical protein
VLALALPVIAYVAGGSADLSFGGPSRNSSADVCSLENDSQTEHMPACSPNVSDHHSPADHAADMPIADPEIDTGALRQRRWSSNGVAGNDHSIGPNDLRPGYTMAELCSIGIAEQEFRCTQTPVNKTVSMPGAKSGSASGYRISGHVLSSEGAGLAGVNIMASPKRIFGQSISRENSLRYWTVTDSLGAYSLEGLPDGEYLIRSTNQDDYPSARINARAGVDFADLVVSRNRTMLATGQVVSAEGWPMEGVVVLPILSGQPSVVTDDDGRFRLPVALKPDTNSFSLSFRRSGYHEKTAKINFQHVSISDVVTVDVLMNPVESWTSVVGTVQSDTGDALAGRMVELKPTAKQQAYRAVTDSEGRYNFPAVEAPAEYRLIVLGGAGHKDHQRSVHVTRNMGELDVVTQAFEFGAVSGRLVNPDGVPVPDFELVLRNAASYGPNTLVSTDRLGNFDIPAAPAGAFVVASQSNPAILVQGLQLEPGEKLHLELVLDWGEHEIHGVVTDANGNPVPASRVVLQWSNETDGITTRATRRTASDMQGNFAFSNLGPGPHSLKIDAPGFLGVDIDHDLSRQGYALTVKLN